MWRNTAQFVRNIRIGKLCVHHSNLHFAFKGYLKDQEVGKHYSCNVVFYLGFLQTTECENDKGTAVFSVFNNVFLRGARQEFPNSSAATK